MRFLEPVAGVFLLLFVAPLIVLVLVAQLYSRTRPFLVVREVWREGSSIKRLEFTRPPGELGLLLRRKALLELASLWWVITGKIRFAELVKWGTWKR